MQAAAGGARASGRGVEPVLKEHHADAEQRA